MTEITSGLIEGDIVITRTISSSTATTSTQSGSSIFNVGGRTNTGGTTRVLQGQ